MEISLGIILIIFAVYAALVIADIIKRGLLSRLVIWSGFMLTAPIIAAYCIYTICTSVIYVGGNLLACEFATAGKLVLLTILSFAVLIAMAVIYIRGHVKPIDKKSPLLQNCDDRRLKFIGARRLVITGSIGTIIYFAAMVVMLYLICDVLWAGNIKDTIMVQLMMLFILLIPFFNLIAIAYYIIVGTYMMAVAFVGIMALLELVLVINGCIRFTVSSDKTKGMKALWIFLSIIPFFNIGYGIYCIAKTSKALKETSNTY
ncbi:MAG: hypothetical protein ACI4J6_04780 [Oscillospiraceae bacterium]